LFLILKYIFQTLSHVDNNSLSEGSNSVFVKDNVLQLMQDILIIAVPIIQQVVVFSFIPICFSGIIRATTEMEMVIGFQFQTIVPKAKPSWMYNISLNQKKNSPGNVKKVMLKYLIIFFG